MAFIGTIVIYVIMICLLLGAGASILRPQSELGKQFTEGVFSIGPIFLSVAGIFASVPYISQFINYVFGPLYEMIGADAAMAATTIIAVDMGGYQLAEALAGTKENWIMAMITGFMAGATIVFTVPIGLYMVPKEKENAFALGIMCGILTVPIGVFVSSVIIALSNPWIRNTISVGGDANYHLMMDYVSIFKNLVPLIIICLLIAAGLMFIRSVMLKVFKIFGKFIEVGAKIVLVLSIVEYFTGIFSRIFGNWGFAPIIAEPTNMERALEIAGYIGMMLAGAFPMVYLIKTYLEKPLGKLGCFLGLSPQATAGILAASANVLALFPLTKNMENRDVTKATAFAVCGAFLFGDHLSFMANFQPTLIVPLMAGKFIAACVAVAFVSLLIKDE
ncbi:MAG: ethanolamine utilization protein EutH [Termitinemataceae bacterium]|nr:MAG: ethanolamine utilization protein EutH [Termitinemataceae bacterium]